MIREREREAAEEICKASPFIWSNMKVVANTSHDVIDSSNVVNLLIIKKSQFLCNLFLFLPKFTNRV